MTILVVVSDHGFGHATRTVAWLRSALALEPRLKARVLCGSGAESLLRHSFAAEPRVRVREGESDPGMLLFPGTLRVDTPGTGTAWRGWMSRWGKWVEAHLDEALGVDGVLCDVAPAGLLLAERAGARAALLGNFAWTDTLAGHLPPDLFERLHATGRLAEASFAFPFTLGFDGAPRPRPLPLVARAPTRPRGQIRRLLGIDPRQPLVYLPAGQSSNLRAVRDAVARAGARVLVPATASDTSGAVRTPAGDPEGQDFLAACDLVVGKIGYGTLSEALTLGVPMVMVLVDRTPETGPLAAGMQREQAGISLAEEDDPSSTIEEWLATGLDRGPGRAWMSADNDAAARTILGWVSSSRL